MSSWAQTNTHTHARAHAHTQTLQAVNKRLGCVALLFISFFPPFLFLGCLCSPRKRQKNRLKVAVMSVLS